MFIASRVKEQTAGWVREQIAYVRGMQGYAYGFPLVIMDLTRKVMTAARTRGHLGCRNGDAEQRHPGCGGVDRLSGPG